MIMHCLLSALSFTVHVATMCCRTCYFYKPAYDVNVWPCTELALHLHGLMVSQLTLTISFF